MSEHTRKETKNMTLRLPIELAEQLQAVAEVEDRPIADVVREAIAAHVVRRRKDARFQQLLNDNLRKHEELLRMLAEG